jgi:hypothetical protein
MHYTGLGHSLERIPRFAPGCQAAYDDKCLKSPFPQKMRHAGARRFLLASAVQVDVLVSREECYFGAEIVEGGKGKGGRGEGDSLICVIYSRREQEKIAQIRPSPNSPQVVMASLLS